jgi:hypothetical protein
MTKIKIVLTTTGVLRWHDEPETVENQKKSYEAKAYLGTAEIGYGYSEDSLEFALGSLMMNLRGAFNEIEFEEKKEWK